MALEYKILTALDPRALDKAVNRYLQDGWSPTGGVCVSPVGSNKNLEGFMQAVVRVKGESR
mgnify:FL=1|jgi:hypothetical protein